MLKEKEKLSECSEFNRTAVHYHLMPLCHRLAFFVLHEQNLKQLDGNPKLLNFWQYHNCDKAVYYKIQSKSSNILKIYQKTLKIRPGPEG